MPTHCSNTGPGLAIAVARLGSRPAAAWRTPRSKKLNRSVDRRFLRRLFENAEMRKLIGQLNASRAPQGPHRGTVNDASIHEADRQKHLSWCVAGNGRFRPRNSGMTEPPGHNFPLGPAVPPDRDRRPAVGNGRLADRQTVGRRVNAAVRR
jgi:hypothetical protein